LLYTEYTTEQGVISIQIVNLWGDNQYKMLIKAPLSEIKRNLTSDYSIDYEAEYNKSIQRGFTAIAFGQRNLD
jgi:hypothetical protein